VFARRGVGLLVNTVLAGVAESFATADRSWSVIVSLTARPLRSRSEPQSSEARSADATGNVFDAADGYSVTDLDRTHEYAVLIGVVAAGSDDRSNAGFYLRLHASLLRGGEKSKAVHSRRECEPAHEPGETGRGNC
jgi:hypothetical protein